MAINDGGPVYPLVEHEMLQVIPGMSLRDHFAAKAMASLTPIYWDTIDEYVSAGDLIECLAEASYEMADAMIRASTHGNES